MILTQENYFSKQADLEYFSVSQFKNFKKCSAKAMHDLEVDSQEDKQCFLEGKMFESILSGDFDLFKAQHPEIISSRGATAGEIKSEFKKVIEAAKRIQDQDFLMNKINKSQKQVILTCKINDIDVKCCLDLLDLDNKAIYDLKCMANFKDEWDKETKCYIPWYYTYDYVLQLAVYQEAVRQNYGILCDTHLISATKENVPDIKAPHLNNKLLKLELNKFKKDIIYYNNIKKGIEPAIRCETCDYCKRTRIINKFEEVS